MDKGKKPFDLIRDIILHEMDDIQKTRVNFFDQKWDIPADNGIFISIGSIGNRILASRNSVEDRIDGFYELQDVNYQEMISIDIFSRDTDALFRKEEIIMALASVYAQQVQEEYSFVIGRIPTSFTQVEDSEPTARLYRFQIVVQVLAWAKKEKVVKYYDSYKAKITNNDGTIVEFDQRTTE